MHSIKEKEQRLVDSP